ncbi:MAG TPA: DUF1080 domain-containing protein [Bryobacteraceae bacterium]|jgi:hypothetical protein
MRSSRLILFAAFVAPALVQAASPLVGHWDFNMPGANRACWLGISEKGGTLDVWYQPTGGNVFEVKDVKSSGGHLSLTLSRPNAQTATTWELDAKGDQLKGVQKHGDQTIELTGVRAPELKHAPPKSWAKAKPLFDGKDLAGWEPIGDPANSHWIVKDGLLINEAHGANLKTTAKFEDFNLHFEVNCPDGANSGFYLRGRYEVQLEYEKTKEPPERSMGAIYGRIGPKMEMPRKPGKWETFDVTLVGRTVTIVRDGVLTVDRKEIEGITGGALDANEGEPGPFYIQGDHTGGLQFRNITVSVAQR